MSTTRHIVSSLAKGTALGMASGLAVVGLMEILTNIRELIDSTAACDPASRLIWNAALMGGAATLITGGRWCVHFLAQDVRVRPETQELLRAMNYTA